MWSLKSTEFVKTEYANNHFKIMERLYILRFTNTKCIQCNTFQFHDIRVWISLPNWFVYPHPKPFIVRCRHLLHFTSDRLRHRQIIKKSNNLTLRGFVHQSWGSQSLTRPPSRSSGVQYKIQQYSVTDDSDQSFSQGRLLPSASGNMKASPQAVKYKPNKQPWR